MSLATVKYVGLRLAQAVFVLWAAYTLSWIVLYLLPSDPVAILASGGLENITPDPELLAEVRERYGFDRPPWEQYLTQLGSALRGDLGESITTGQPVTAVLAAAIPVTIPLALLAFLVAVPLGVGLALAANAVRSRWLSDVLFAAPSLFVSIPTFWLGLLLLQVFAFRFGLFPALSTDTLAGLVLPCLTLAIPTSAIIAQILSRSIEAALAEPYITVARAKGLPRRRVLIGHALRNAILPALTVLGLLAGNLFAGSIVVETVFARSGLGRLTARAVTAQDIPVVQGVVLTCALLFVGINLIVDLVYPLVDRRITVARNGRAS